MSLSASAGSGARAFPLGGLLASGMRLQESGANWPVFKVRVAAALALEWHVVEPASGAGLHPAGGAAAVPTGKRATAAAAASASAAEPADHKGGAGALSPEDAAHSARAYSVLIALLSDTHLYLVMPPHVASGDAAGVWRVLLAHFERKTMASKAHTRRMLHKSKMGEDEQFDMFKARVLTLATQLRGMGEHVSDGELIYALLEGLPASYRTVRQALEVQDALTLEGLSAHLRDHQERRKYDAEKEEEEDEIAHFAGRHGGGRSGGGGGGGGRAQQSHTQARGQGAGGHGQRGGAGSEAEYRCRLCRTVGHWESFCPSRRGSGNACFRCGSNSHQMRDCRAPAGAKGRREEEEEADAHALYVMEDIDF